MTDQIEIKAEIRQRRTGNRNKQSEIQTINKFEEDSVISSSDANVTNSSVNSDLTENKHQKTDHSQTKSDTVNQLCTQNYPFNFLTNLFKMSNKRAINLEVDVFVIILFLLGALTRFWRLDRPRRVVFDEVHFGKATNYYIQRMNFFDLHPPLGKLLFTLAGYMAGYSDTAFGFEQIDQDVPIGVPLIAMRSVSALCGTFIPILIYYICVDLKLSRWTALLGGIFAVADNALLVQSRFIMLDTPLIVFNLISVLLVLKLLQLHTTQLSVKWWGHLMLIGIFTGLSVSTKHSGILTLGFILLVTSIDFFETLPTVRNTYSLMYHILARMAGLVGIPVLVHLIVYSIHFKILIYSNPNDIMFSFEYQNSLLRMESNQPTIDKVDVITYGSLIRLKHSTDDCYLHSHMHMYPLKYDDERGSSYQQQVTCYPFMDDNNWWVVAKPGTIHDNVTVDLKDLSHEPVTDGTIIELFHRTTGRRLNSHNVAAPLTPTAQEVSGYINYSAAFAPHTHWRLRLLDAMRYEKLWVPSAVSGGGSMLYLEHIETNLLLASTGQQLPEWGFFQKEIVATRSKLQKSTTWSVSQAYYPFLDQTNITNLNHSLGGVTVHSPNTVRVELKRQRNRGLVKKLSFLAMFIELNMLMFSAHGLLTSHSFSSEASQWPLLDKNVPYWLDNQDFKQIHLLGNPLVWWMGVACICIYILILTVLLARRHRGVDNDVTEDQWCKISRGGVFLLVGWAFQYLPYFLLHRCLFLHHYLPALTFKIMLTAAVCEYLSYFVKVPGDNSLNSLIILFAYVLIATVSLMFFYVFQVVSYGSAEITQEDSNILSLGKNWEIYYRELF